MKIEYHEVSAEKVVRFFVEGYGASVEEHNWFFDATKGQFILKLYVKDKKYKAAP